MTAFMELLVNARHIDSSDDNAVLDAVIRLQRRPTYPTEDEVTFLDQIVTDIVFRGLPEEIGKKVGDWA